MDRLVRPQVREVLLRVLHHGRIEQWIAHAPTNGHPETRTEFSYKLLKFGRPSSARQPPVLPASTTNRFARGLCRPCAPIVQCRARARPCPVPSVLPALESP